MERTLYSVVCTLDLWFCKTSYFMPVSSFVEMSSVPSLDFLQMVLSMLFKKRVIAFSAPLWHRTRRSMELVLYTKWIFFLYSLRGDETSGWVALIKMANIGTFAMWLVGPNSRQVKTHDKNTSWTVEGSTQVLPSLTGCSWERWKHVSWDLQYIVVSGNGQWATNNKASFHWFIPTS